MQNVIPSVFHFHFSRSFRLQSQRPLKKLMVDDQGCDKYKPGIGNIAYVKDIQTEKIVTTGYRCTIFGRFYHPSTGLGWVSINSLQKFAHNEKNETCSFHFTHQLA